MNCILIEKEYNIPITIERKISMKLFVVGSTGRVATELLKQLVAKGHTVLAGARQPENIAVTGVIPVKFDLHDSEDHLAQQLQDAEAIIFTAGSRGKDLLQTDAFGAVKVMNAANKAKIDRFIMLSALYSLTPKKWPQTLTDYYIAKFFADNYLVHNTKLNYTIIQPGELTEKNGTHQISLEATEITSIPIQDVAETLATVVDKESTYRKVIAIHPGTRQINKIFNN